MKKLLFILFFAQLQLAFAGSVEFLDASNQTVFSAEYTDYHTFVSVLSQAKQKLKSYRGPLTMHFSGSGNYKVSGNQKATREEQLLFLEASIYRIQFPFQC